jgi:hypothetical protein
LFQAEEECEVTPVQEEGLTPRTGGGRAPAAQQFDTAVVEKHRLNVELSSMRE